jgi:hypothetical protein
MKKRRARFGAHHERIRMEAKRAANRRLVNLYIRRHFDGYQLPYDAESAVMNELFRRAEAQASRRGVELIKQS